MADERSTSGWVSQSHPSPLPEAIAPTRPATLIAKETLGDHLGLVTLGGEKLGARVRPGQFCMLWRPQRDTHRPGEEVRPFAYFAAPTPDTAQFLVRERSDGQTTLLDAPLGTQVPFVGPLGRPYPPLVGRVWAVAGGVGAAALGSLLPPPAGVELKLLVGLRRQAEAGIEAALRARAQGVASLEVIHEEGPQGGTVMALLAKLLSLGAAPPDMLLGCGPEPMLRALCAEASLRNIRAFVSVNTPLPCGVGTCGKCVLKDARGEAHLSCIDGPIYPGELLFGAAP